MLHYAIFRATSVATAKSAFLQLHEQRCYTMQCFLQLVSQLVPQRTRLRLKAYFYWLIAQNVARQVARGVLHCAMFQKKCCETWWLRDVLHRAIFRPTCVATKLRDKLHEKLCSVTPPLIMSVGFYCWKCSKRLFFSAICSVRSLTAWENYWERVRFFVTIA